MAVFMINICKFNGCGITFPSLGDLIQHIEDIHIDYDPLVVEQKEASQPSCVPLSYVLRYFTEATRREFHSTQAAPDVRRRVASGASGHKTPSVRSSTPTGSELDEEEIVSPSEDSNDSWTTVEEYSSEFILRYGSRIQSQVGAVSIAGGPVIEKPFACPVPGCKKRYKNVNGIKYHSKNGHKKDGKIKKGYKCQCGKNYKTALGLRNHTIMQHLAVVPHEAQQLAISPIPLTPRSIINDYAIVQSMGDFPDTPTYRASRAEIPCLELLTPSSTPGNSPTDTLKLKFKKETQASSKNLRRQIMQ